MKIQLHCTNSPSPAEDLTQDYNNIIGDAMAPSGNSTDSSILYDPFVSSEPFKSPHLGFDAKALWHTICAAPGQTMTFVGGHLPTHQHKDRGEAPHHHLRPAMHRFATDIRHWVPMLPQQPVEWLVPMRPDSDIRETKLAYTIEMELPGVTDKADVLIQWMSPRTLVVEGEAKRGDVGIGKGGEGESMWPEEPEKKAAAKNGAAPANGNAQLMHGNTPVNGNGNEADEKLHRCPDIDDDAGSKLLLGERNLGPWHRSFSMPADVDMKTLKAKLEGGLLRISMLKRNMTGEPVFKVEIE